MATVGEEDMGISDHKKKKKKKKGKTTNINASQVSTCNIGTRNRLRRLAASSKSTGGTNNNAIKTKRIE